MSMSKEKKGGGKKKNWHRVVEAIAVDACLCCEKEKKEKRKRKEKKNRHRVVEAIAVDTDVAQAHFRAERQVLQKLGVLACR